MAISFGSNSISNLKLGSTQVLAVYQGSDLVWPSVFPPATNYLVSSPSDATFLSDIDFTLGGPSSAEVRQDFRFRKSGNSVIFEVKGGILGGTQNRYYPVGGGSSTLSTSYVSITEIAINGGIDAVRLDWSTIVSPTGGTVTLEGDTTNTSSTFVAGDNEWRTLSNGQSIGFIFGAAASITYVGIDSCDTTISVDVWVRKSGLPDTKIGTFEFRNQAEANSEV